jgi:hypothetical protein
MARRLDLDRDEIEVTRGEKLLAVVLSAFVLVGLIWGYDKLEIGGTHFGAEQVTQAERAAIDRAAEAQRDLSAAHAARSSAREQLELSREAYRTALDANRPAAALELEYRQAQQQLDRAEQELRRAERRAEVTEPAAAAAHRRAAERAEAERRTDARWTFLLRLGYALLALAVAYGLVVATRGSRLLPVAFACVGAAATLALVMAADYIEDYVEWRQAGPLVLSVAGIGLTLAALWALQRYLQRRIPLRRVRKGECPFCGFPVRANERCEGCGRQVIAPCSTCGEPRRVGVAYCGACGNA